MDVGSSRKVNDGKLNVFREVVNGKFHKKTRKFPMHRSLIFSDNYRISWSGIRRYLGGNKDSVGQNSLSDGELS
jgi:hypothetical protein